MAAALAHKKVITQLRKLGNPVIAEHSQRFFKTGKGEYGEGDKFLGLRVPVLRALVREYKELSFTETELLLHSAYHEARLLALLIWVAQFKTGSDRVRKQIADGYLSNTAYINNWDLVDSSAHLIIGPWMEGKPHALLKRLARSSLIWERRIAMMSTLHFIRQKQFETALLIAEILLHDKEDLIHKIVGWMLREIGNRDRAAEEVFLQKYAAVMPRTMLRYAIEKFPEEQRKRYLAGGV